MKKIACLLVAVMLLACLPLTAFAANKTGDVVVIEFTAENPGLTGFQATINYDATALKLGNIECAVKGALVDINGNDIAVIATNAFTDTLLFTAEFEVLADAKFGETYAEGCLFYPDTNIRYGCWYLGFLTRRFNGNAVCAAAAYHAGQGTVDGWLANPEYSDDGATLKEIPSEATKTYVTRVLRYYERYKALYAPQAA